jgi:hypothetical protein
MRRCETIDLRQRHARSDPNGEIAGIVMLDANQSCSGKQHVSARRGRSDVETRPCRTDGQSPFIAKPQHSRDFLCRRRRDAQRTCLYREAMRFADDRRQFSYDRRCRRGRAHAITPG